MPGLRRAYGALVLAALALGSVPAPATETAPLPVPRSDGGERAAIPPPPRPDAPAPHAASAEPAPAEPASPARSSEPPPPPRGRALAGPAPETGGPVAGPVTGLALPRYVSLRAGEANLRRGPGRQYRVDWVFRRRGLPVRVTAEYGDWRRVEDHEGAEGWVHRALLTGRRTAIVAATETVMRTAPRAEARAVARLAEGVVGRLDGCEGAWCALRAAGHDGWVEAGALWGAGGTE
ncbi:MAG: SH3 domain-containing protein [Paracoccaceae bacterium]